MADLQGRVIAFLEARRAAELADLIRRHRGVPYAAPCLHEVHRPEAAELGAAIQQLCRPEVGVALFLTGVGTQTILEAARRHNCELDLLAALAAKRVAARGPKPVAVLRKAGVRLDLAAPPPHTSRELLAALAAWDLRGQTVAVQLYGAPNPQLRAELEERGAEVVELQPYAWDRPADPGPVLDLIGALQAGRIDALLGTSAAQVDNLCAIAREQRQAEALTQALRRIPVAAQGPICAAAFERAGVPAAITPPHGHMGALVLAVAHHFAQENVVAEATGAAQGA